MEDLSAPLRAGDSLAGAEGESRHQHQHQHHHHDHHDQQHPAREGLVGTLEVGEPHGEEATAADRGCREFFRKWQLWICIGCFSFIMGAPAVLLTIWTSDASAEATMVAVSALFVAISVPVSLHDIYRHLVSYWQPVLQQYVVRILWMVPIYAITSFTALVLWVTDQEQYTYVPTAFRQCYEAYTVYNFFKYLITFLEMHHGMSPTAVLVKSHPGLEAVAHFFPFRIALPTASEVEALPSACCTAVAGLCRHAPSKEGWSIPPEEVDQQDDGIIEEWSAGRSSTEEMGQPAQEDRRVYRCLFQDWNMQNGEFVNKCAFGVHLYVALMPLSAFISVLFSFLDLYHEETSGSSIYFWNESFVLVFSSYAIYCLVMFYHIAVGDLAATAPFTKFVCVKGIVFFTFFQNFVIAVYFHLHEVSDFSKTVGVVSNTVMCVEMFLFAIGHHVAFPHTQYPRVTEETCRGPQQRWLVEWGNYYTRRNSYGGAWANEADAEHAGGRGGRVHLGDMLDTRDVQADTMRAWRQIGRSVVKAKHSVAQKVPSMPSGMLFFSGSGPADGEIDSEVGGDEEEDSDGHVAAVF